MCGAAHNEIGADTGNRTPIVSLEGCLATCATRFAWVFPHLSAEDPSSAGTLMHQSRRSSLAPSISTVREWMHGLPVFFRITTLPASSVQAVPLGPALAAFAFTAETKIPAQWPGLLRPSWGQ